MNHEVAVALAIAANAAFYGGIAAVVTKPFADQRPQVVYVFPGTVKRWCARVDYVDPLSDRVWIQLEADPRRVLMIGVDDVAIPAIGEC